MDLHRQVHVVIKGWPVGMISRGKGSGYVPGEGDLAVSSTKTVFTDEITHVMRMDWFSRSSGMRRRNMRFLSPPWLCPTSPAPQKGTGSMVMGSLQKVPTCQHVLIGIVRDGENVGWSFTPFLSPVGSHHLSIVDGQPLVGVDSHTEEPRVGLKKGAGGSESGGVTPPAGLRGLQK